MDDLISVIVPIYTTEQYLKKCVASIRKQTYKKIEIILVDDGSPDQSAAICDQIAEEDDRVIVIHKNNGGLSDARNIGMKIASGSYIVFCDSDDWMEADIIESAYREAVSTDVDMVIWSYTADYYDLNGKYVNSSECIADEVIEKGKANCLGKSNVQGLLGYAWNKLYKREYFIENCFQFPNGVSLVEDVLLNSQILRKCRKIKLIRKIGTHYIQREQNTLGNAYYHNYGELIWAAAVAKRKTMKHFRCPDIIIRHSIENYLIMALKVGILNIVRSDTSTNDEKIKQMKAFLSDRTIVRLIKHAEGQHLKDKLFLFLLKSFHSGYYYLRKMAW